MRIRRKLILVLASLAVLAGFGVLYLSSVPITSEITIRPSEQSSDKNSPENKVGSGSYVFRKPYCLIFHGLDTPSDYVNSGQFKINVYVDDNSNLGYFGFILFKKSIRIRAQIKYSWNHPLKSISPTETGSFEIRGRYKVVEAKTREEAFNKGQSFLIHNIQNQIEKEIQLALNAE